MIDCAVIEYDGLSMPYMHQIISIERCINKTCQGESQQRYVYRVFAVNAVYIPISGYQHCDVMKGPAK